MKLWSIRDGMGHSILFHTHEYMDDADMQFFCREMIRHKFMSAPVVFVLMSSDQVKEQLD